MESQLFVVSYIVLWASVVLIGFLVVGMARHILILHQRLGPRGGMLPSSSGLPVGTQVPNIHVREAGAEAPIEIHSLLSPRGVTLGFVRSGCESCDDLLGELLKHPELVGELNLTIVVPVDDEPDALGFARSAGIPVLVDDSEFISGRLGVPGVPFFFVLDASGRVVEKGVANTVEQLEVLATVQIPLMSQGNGGENHASYA